MGNNVENNVFVNVIYINTHQCWYCTVLDICQWHRSLKRTMTSILVISKLQGGLLPSWWRKVSNMTVRQSSVILNPPLLRLTSRKPLWLDLQPADIESWWRRNRKSAQVVNSHLVCDPTIRQLGFDLPRQQWSLLNRFRTEQGHCSACGRKRRLTDTNLCPCG